MACSAHGMYLVHSGGPSWFLRQSIGRNEEIIKVSPRDIFTSPCYYLLFSISCISQNTLKHELRWSFKVIQRRNRPEFLLPLLQAVDLFDLLEYISILSGLSMFIRFDPAWFWHPKEGDSLTVSMLIIPWGRVQSEWCHLVWLVYFRWRIPRAHRRKFSICLASLIYPLQQISEVSLKGKDSDTDLISHIHIYDTSQCKPFQGNLFE